MCVIPAVRELAIDHVDTVRETLASQLDKVVLYFLRVNMLLTTLLMTQSYILLVLQMVNVCPIVSLRV